jgi:hypothetical protein
MENRYGMVVDVEVTRATGTSEREAGLRMLRRSCRPGRRRTLGADKQYDSKDSLCDAAAMQEHRLRLARYRLHLRWSLGIFATATVVAQFFTSQPLHDILHIAFVAGALTIIVYEAFITASPYLGAAGVVLQAIAAWPRSGGYTTLGGTLTCVVAIYLLATRPVAGTAPSPAASAPAPVVEPAPPSEALPRLGDPDFRYLPPPGAPRSS